VSRRQAGEKEGGDVENDENPEAKDRGWIWALVIMAFAAAVMWLRVGW